MHAPLSSPLPGRATADATKNYADRMWQHNPRISPDCWHILEGLTVAEIGFGAYRLQNDTEQQAALAYALTHGINLIDTASIYTDGISEATIGSVLKNLVKTHKLQREQVVLVSKAGYLQGSLLQRYMKAPPPETVQVHADLWHCIHPAFLAEQLAESRSRLGVETIDGYLLHNPEYFLFDAAEKGIPTADAQHMYYQRLEQAFAFLETACQQNHIVFYGVSSNTFTAPAHSIGFTDLQKVFIAAQNAAATVWGRKKRPLFRCVQFPCNLLETGAIREMNTLALTFSAPEVVSTLELASRMHLAVLANRPLTAFVNQHTALRLVDEPAAAQISVPPLPELLQHAAQIEHQLSHLLGQWPTMSQHHTTPAFSLTREGTTAVANISTRVHFDYIFHTVLAPQFSHTLEQLRTLTTSVSFSPTVRQQLAQATQNYAQLFDVWVSGLKRHVGAREAAMFAPVRQELYHRLPATWQHRSLQQVALKTIASTPGITCVLNGMHNQSYVHDALAVLEQPDFADVAAILGSHNTPVHEKAG